MNKTVTTVASVIAVLGLATAWIFKVIDGTTFATVSVAVIATLNSIIKAKEVKELKATLLDKEDEIADTKLTNSKLVNDINTIKSGALTTEIVVEKPKRIRKK